MMNVVWCLPVLVLAFSAPVFADSAAVPADRLEQRLSRIERLLESQSLLDMMERLDASQMEVQQLRGQLEEQQHQMEGMKNRQRELYLDIDRRMLRLEREGGSSSVTPAAPLNSTAAAATSPATPTTPLTSAPLTTVNSAPSAAVTPATPPQAASPAVADPQQLAQEREAYQQAFELLRELRYEQATVAFRDFLTAYPHGNYAHNAQYWLGEAAYARRDFVQAINDYQALLQNHPRGTKRAEAMLKIGYSYQELKKTEESKKIMEQLIELYPDSTEAGQARNQLRRMKKSGG
jgi:tol-pal system protein YbgF